MVSGELCGLLNAKHDFSFPHTSFPHVPATYDPQDHRREWSAEISIVSLSSCTYQGRHDWWRKLKGKKSSSPNKYILFPKWRKLPDATQSKHTWQRNFKETFWNKWNSWEKKKDVSMHSMVVLTADSIGEKCYKIVNKKEYSLSLS